MGWSLALPVIGKLIDRIIPDKKAAAEAKIKMMEMDGDLLVKELDAMVQVNLAQARINEMEAKSDNLFKAGWRPLIGWTCAIGIIWGIIVQPVVAWICAIEGVPPPPPIEWSELLAIAIPLLGIGGMRSWEKKQGLTR